MDEEHRQKIRQTHLKLAHGDNWTEEDQEKFERERNRRQCLNHRNKHREAYTDYQRCYQQRYREQNRFHYRVCTMEPFTSRQPNDIRAIHRIPKTERRKEGAKR